jgi:hypothetical protein
MEMSVVLNFDINWNELEQIEMDDELENTFLRLKYKHHKKCKINTQKS